MSYSTDGATVLAQRTTDRALTAGAGVKALLGFGAAVGVTALAVNAYRSPRLRRAESPKARAAEQTRARRKVPC